MQRGLCNPIFDVSAQCDSQEQIPKNNGLVRWLGSVLINPQQPQFWRKRRIFQFGADSQDHQKSRNLCFNYSTRISISKEKWEIICTDRCLKKNLNVYFDFEKELRVDVRFPNQKRKESNKKKILIRGLFMMKESFHEGCYCLHFWCAPTICCHCAILNRWKFTFFLSEIWSLCTVKELERQCEVTIMLLLEDGQINEQFQFCKILIPKIIGFWPTFFWPKVGKQVDTFERLLELCSHLILGKTKETLPVQSKTAFILWCLPPIFVLSKSPLFIMKKFLILPNKH